jgi:hypothetical protein
MNRRRIWSRVSLITALSIAGSVVGPGARASGLGRIDPAVVEARPVGRGSMGLAYDIDRRELVLFGGIAQFGDEARYLGDTWTWDRSGWTARHPRVSPPAVYGVGMAYDEARHEVVLFGGSNDHVVSDQTWTWDGTDWTRRHPSTSPPPEFGGAMAYDPVRREVVLLQGNLFSPGTTWTWDGTDWTEESPSSTPSARVFSTSAFDVADGTFVVFGGGWSCGDLTCPLGDTWTWDGATWTEQHPQDHPSDRLSAAAAYDPNAGEIVLFGRGYYESPRDTWTWDGSNWSKLEPLRSPPRRSGAGMAYDPDLGKVVLFGGTTFAHNQLHSYNDLWVWDGTSWSRVG